MYIIFTIFSKMQPRLSLRISVSIERGGIGRSSTSFLPPFSFLFFLGKGGLTVFVMRFSSFTTKFCIKYLE